MLKAIGLPRLILALLLAFSGVTGSSQTLWKEARSGMTTKELLKTIKGLVPNPEDEEMADGWKSPYILKGVILDSKPFIALFYFKNDKLMQVALQASKDIDKIAAILTYDDLLKSLTDKYGKPKRSDIDEDRKVTIWYFGKVDITLYYVEINESRNLLKVIYGTRLSKERDNL